MTVVDNEYDVTLIKTQVVIVCLVDLLFDKIYQALFSFYSLIWNNVL